MTQNFKITLLDNEFEFNSMNRVRLQLYQVYVTYNGKRHRFHMQITTEGTFRITDKAACPEEYLHLESTLNDAIFKLGEVIVQKLE